MQNTYFFLSFLMFILPYFRERTGILVWRAVVCVFARLRLCSFSSPCVSIFGGIYLFGGLFARLRTGSS